MKLTLKIQQMEMRSSFSEVHVRIDNLSRQFDSHRQETALNFRQIDQRFDKLEGRINKIPSELAEALSPYLVAIEAMLENHDKRICTLEQ